MRNYPDPPLIEFCFYFSDRHEAEAFAAVVETVLEQQRIMSVAACIVRTPHARNLQFEAPASVDVSLLTSGPVEVQFDRQELQKELRSDDARVLSISYLTESNTDLITPEVITYCRIAEHAVGVDSHPIAIQTSGLEMDLLQNSVRRNSIQIKEISQKIFERFQWLTNALNPSYASITMEYSLECPTELLGESRSFAFKDFYVSRAFVNRKAMNSLRDLFSDAYQQTTASGVFLSTHLKLIGTKAQMDPDVRERLSIAAGRIIGEEN